MTLAATDVPPAANSITKPSRPPSRSRSQLSRWTLLFAAPAVALYLFVLLVPTAQGVFVAFTDYNGIRPVSKFVGFDNFIRVFNDRDSVHAIWITIVIAVAVTVIQNVIGLLIALGVNSRIKSRHILRVFFFAPAVMTPVVTSYLWSFILAPAGPLNSVLMLLGLSGYRQNWLGDPTWALISIIGVIVWQFSGYSMVIFLAGLQGISQEILEAADVDGAGPVRKFFSVTRPLLGPAITINLMLSIIGGLKLFDQVWVMTGGGPGGSTDTLSTRIYRDAFQFNEYSTSIAMAIILFIMVAIISAVQYRSLVTQEVRE